jgi:enamine deaminase RidA (YjgF/YER057c/UK114 family)
METALSRIAWRGAQVLALLLAASASGTAGADQAATEGAPSASPAARRFVNPPGLWTPRGFTHAVVASGTTVFVSGQVAYDAKGELVGKGDLRAQTKQVYENLKLALVAAGASFADVVRSNAYVVNLKREDLAVIREVRSGYLPAQGPPASTVVGVAALANPECLIEIEVTAVMK